MSNAMWTEKPPAGNAYAPQSPPVAAPPPPAAPPLSTLTEKASQLAGKISSQSEFETALSSVPGGASLAPEDKGKLWDTVQKTRVGQGLPPASTAPPVAAPGGPPQPLVGGGAPVSPAVQSALPPSVSGAPVPPPAAKAPGAAAPTGLGQVPGQDAVPQYAPPTPTAAYKSPDLETASYKAPEYKTPNKGIQYAAAALSLLFPGSLIGRAAGSFSQGMNVGADERYKRDQQTADANFKSDEAKDATINQGRLAQASGNFTAAQLQDKAVAARSTADYQNQVSIYNDRQTKRAQGMDPNTGKPFQLPAQLIKTPDTKQGYDGLAQWHQARALAYEQLGATGPAAQETAASKEATTQATNAANNARALVVAAQNLRQQLAIHNDTQNREDRRQGAAMSNSWAIHNDTEFNANQRALLTDTRERAAFGTKASAADKSLFTTWEKYTKPQTKTVETKDVNGNVTSIHDVPLVDDKGNPVPPPISGNLEKSLADLVNKVRRDSDPVSAAQYYGQHLDNSPGGLAGQEVLQQAGEAANMRMLSNGRLPVPHAFPKTVEPAAPQEPHVASAPVVPPTPPHSYSHRGDDKVNAIGSAIANTFKPDARHAAGAAAHPPAAAAPAAPHGTPDAAGHVPGQVYEDANGHRALYNGNNSWTPQ